MEFSGEVVATGKAVTDLQPGDKVMAIAASAFSTHVRVDRAGVAKLPLGVDAVAAATIPVVFLTAYYAMHELAASGRAKAFSSMARQAGLALRQSRSPSISAPR